jgi:hypothetical protein
MIHKSIQRSISQNRVARLDNSIVNRTNMMTATAIAICCCKNVANKFIPPPADPCRRAGRCPPDRRIDQSVIPHVYRQPSA